MQREQQIQIITDLMNGLRDEAIRRVNDGSVPEEWDGAELRQYLADRAADQFPMRTMDRKRMKEYRNTVIINNL